MDEAVSLQVLHPFAHVLAHAQQQISAEMALSLSEEVQKAAPFHELGDDVDGSLLGAYAIELYQLGVRELPGNEDRHIELPQEKKPAGVCAGWGQFFIQKGGPGRS